MTDRKQAMQELLDMVEDGDGDLAFRPFMFLDDAALFAWNAFNGSLDAAKELHEAVLPGWSGEARISGFGNAQSSVWNPMGQQGIGEIIRVDHKDNPARAWLIAIIKALIAKEDAA